MSHRQYDGERRAMHSAGMTSFLAPRGLPKHRLPHALSRFAFRIRSLAAEQRQRIDVTYVKQVNV
jgi:hypothetical protein